MIWLHAIFSLDRYMLNFFVLYACTGCAHTITFSSMCVCTFLYYEIILNFNILNHCYNTFSVYFLRMLVKCTKSVSQLTEHAATWVWEIRPDCKRCIICRWKSMALDHFSPLSGKIQYRAQIYNNSFLKSPKLILKNSFHDILQNVKWISGNPDLRSFINVDLWKTYSFTNLCLLVPFQKRLE